MIIVMLRFNDNSAEQGAYRLAGSTLRPVFMLIIVRPRIFESNSEITALRN